MLLKKRLKNLINYYFRATKRLRATYQPLKKYVTQLKDTWISDILLK